MKTESLQKMAQFLEQEWLGETGDICFFSDEIDEDFARKLIQFGVAYESMQPCHEIAISAMIQLWQTIATKAEASELFQRFDPDQVSFYLEEIEIGKAEVANQYELETGEKYHA